MVKDTPIDNITQTTVWANWKIFNSYYPNYKVHLHIFKEKEGLGLLSMIKISVRNTGV